MVSPKQFFKDTKIGKRVTIEPYVVIGEKVVIKNNVKINSFLILKMQKSTAMLL